MPSYERTFALHVPSSTENLALIRDFVSNIGTQAGFDDNEVAASRSPWTKRAPTSSSTPTDWTRRAR